MTIPGSQPAFAGIDTVEELLERAVALEPRFAAAHAALGNLLLRRGRGFEALQAYRLATTIDPSFASAQLALGELLHLAGDRDGAAAAFARALAEQRVFAAPSPPVPSGVGGPLAVLALLAPLGWSANVPLDFVLDPQQVVLHRWYVDDELREPLPPYDLVFDALGESEAAAGAQLKAARFLAQETKPTINPVARLAATARPALGATLRGIAAIVVPAARRAPAAGLAPLAAELGYPLLVRPVDAHGGRGLVRLDDAAALRAYAGAADAALVDVSAFVDYRSTDGWFRKYRVICIDGVPYPYHLATAPAWNVHYRSSATPESPELRAEERHFLADPASVFGDWSATGAALAKAVGLDYFGVDCARLGDGRWLVFEADPAMLVYDGDAGPGDDDKRGAVDAIRVALQAMLKRRAASR